MKQAKFVITKNNTEDNKAVKNTWVKRIVRHKNIPKTITKAKDK